MQRGDPVLSRHWISQTLPSKSRWTKRDQSSILIVLTRCLIREQCLASLAEGSSFDEILKDYPSLSEDQLRAVVAFAAATAKEDLPLLAAPTIE
jgi:hypothetical protein